MKILWYTAFLIVSSYTIGNAVEYQVDKSKENKAVFYSEAPLEDIEGVTDKIDGYVYWEGDLTGENADLSTSEFYFEVALDAIDTGIGLRNRHMRENYLETGKYPFTKYTGKFESVEEVSGDQFRVISEGTFSIHGVKKNLEISGAAFKNNDGYRIQFEFEINLNDYNIEVPRLMFLKVSDTVRVKLDFYIVIVQSEG